MADSSVSQQQLLYDLLTRRIRAQADLARRETGVHALWLGYPLLYIPGDDQQGSQWALAPLFLWPLSVHPKLRHGGRVEITRARDVGPARMNQALATWLLRQNQHRLPGFREDELAELDWPALQPILHDIASCFDPPLSLDCEGPLEPVPDKDALALTAGPRLCHSAVLGYFRQQNQSILADIEALKSLPELGGVVSSFVSGTALNRPADAQAPPEHDRYLVTPADFSQEQVVWQSRSAPGLVLHGPPGTGKSQTIVNIIADALARGRTVLMVCQKQAATRVVMERLKAVGLDRLCIEVHDPETERLAVFKMIRSQVEQLPGAALVEPQAERVRLCEEIGVLEASLDRYARAVHERNPRYGLSFCQMKSREARIYRSFPTVRPLTSLRPLLARCSAPEVDRLARSAQSVGELFHKADALRNPWRFHQPDLHYSFHLQTDIDLLLQRLTGQDAAHQMQVAQEGAGMCLPPALTDFLADGPQLLEKLEAIANSTKARAQLTRYWLRVVRGCSDSELQEHFARCYEATKLTHEASRHALDSLCEDACKGMNPLQLATVQANAERVLQGRHQWWRSISPSYCRARRALRALRPDALGDRLFTAAEALQLYVDVQRLRVELAQANRHLVPNFRPRLLDDEHARKYPQLALEALKDAAYLADQARRQLWLMPLLNSLVPEGVDGSLSLKVAEVRKALKRAPLAQQLLRSLDELAAYMTEEGLHHARGAVVKGCSIQDWLHALARGFERLEAMLTLSDDRLHHRMGTLGGVLGLLETYEQQRADGKSVPQPPDGLTPDRHGEWWAALVEYTAVLSWQDDHHREYPELRRITPEVHATQVRQLRELTERKRALESSTILARWQARQMQCRNHPWNQFFQIRDGKVEHAKRMREAVELALPYGLLTMRPCWLVGPEAACQIFPLQPGLFDLVIFDEASQCPLEMAVSAIHRGRVLIVSGDDKQLPPTGFFGGKLDWDSLEDDESEEDEGMEGPDAPQSATPPLTGMPDLTQVIQKDLERTIDLLTAAKMLLPERWICVHYRSAHRDLIEFSNHAFYDGRLLTPPSPKEGAEGIRPIEYRHVAGRYLKNRTNPEEAQAVVQLLHGFWVEQESCPTLGIVTFNQPQRELIEKLIDEQRAADERFAVRYEQEVVRQESNQDVGFFVRNLENIQGDERDVMIFSTTFGRTPDGKFYRRFGPVSADGGERRLNVAVTRARQQNIIVSSMPIEEIAPVLSAFRDKSAKLTLTPAGYLQLYLAYAQAVSERRRAETQALLQRLPKVNSSEQAPEEPESPLEEEVKATVENLGYAVDCQVGESGFRIDLAVRHPEPERGYILGIECDGAAYHSSRSARIRDVWREDILRSRGWSIHRIWSTRWWYYRQEEVEKLKLAIARCL